MNWWQAILAGAGIGTVLMPIFVYSAKFYRNLRNRLLIKKLIRLNKFLIPIDTRDYDSKIWADKINPKDHEEQLANFNKLIFRKSKIITTDPFEDKKVEIDDEFKQKVVGYLEKARGLGYDDEFIVGEFKKRNYPTYFINQIFNEYGRNP